MPNCVKPGEVASLLIILVLDFFFIQYWVLSIHLLAINIVPSENMIFGCKLSDLDFEAFHDLSIICILQFVLMKCITAPNVTLFSRSTRISRRPGALSRSQPLSPDLILRTAFQMVLLSTLYLPFLFVFYLSFSPLHLSLQRNP